VSSRRRYAVLPWLVSAIVSLPVYLADGASPPTVLFDQGHGQKFLIEGNGKLDLSDFAAVFRTVGVQVSSSRDELTDARLSGVAAVVVSGPFTAFTPAEIEAITHFLNGGGRLAVMLHIPFPVAPLLQRLAIDFSNGVIRERENLIGEDPLNFHVRALSTHPLTQRLESFDAFGVWALHGTTSTTTIIAQTSATAWIDLNGNNRLEKGDAVQSFGVAAVGQFGAGRFVVFGDDAIFQNQFLSGGNAVLAKNLACWLTSIECKSNPSL
jgi:hypothetical protein